MNEDKTVGIALGIRLETERCILRSPDMHNTDRLLSAFASERFPQFVPLGLIDTSDQVQDWLRKVLLKWEAGRAYSFVAEERTGGLVVGQVTLSQLAEPSEEKWALAFWTHPDRWGKGYATELGRRAIEFGFCDLGAQRIWASAAAENEPSLRVLQKLGMTFVQENREGYRINNRAVLTMEYELISTVWAARRQA